MFTSIQTQTYRKIHTHITEYKSREEKSKSGKALGKTICV